MSWTTPVEVRERIERYWQRGELLAAYLAPHEPGSESLFPLAINLKGPRTKELTERFGAVMDWVEELQAGSKEGRGFGYDLRWKAVNNRVHGGNELPVAAIFPRVDDALKLIGRYSEAKRAEVVASTILKRRPDLRAWTNRRPLTLLEYEEEWERLLAVVDWFAAHPRSGLYLRQLDIPGVDTKFIEGRRGLLLELLDEVLAEEVVDKSATGVKGFAHRYGLREESPAVRFRLLDSGCYIQGLSDLSVPAHQFAQLDLPVERVFVTENVTNGLAFPDVPQSLVVFGLGYGLDRLALVPWLHNVEVLYWGDIDTHGFGILNSLRSLLPNVRSFLMGRATLEAHKSLWVQEPEGKRYTGEPSNLTSSEYSLFDDLRHDRLGERVRLEQERVGFGWLQQQLATLGGKGGLG